jgi:hypothetical protein
MIPDDQEISLDLSDQENGDFMNFEIFSRKPKAKDLKRKPEETDWALAREFGFGPDDCRSSENDDSVNSLSDDTKDFLRQLEEDLKNPKPRRKAPWDTSTPDSTESEGGTVDAVLLVPPKNNRLTSYEGYQDGGGLFPILCTRRPKVGSLHEFREELGRMQPLHSRRFRKSRKLTKNILYRCKSGPPDDKRRYKRFIKLLLIGRLIKYTKTFPLERRYCAYLGQGVFEIQRLLPDYLLYEIIKALSFVQSSILYSDLELISKIGIRSVPHIVHKYGSKKLEPMGYRLRTFDI